MITNFKIFEKKETPKFKIGDDVIVQYDLKQYNYPYGIVKGDIVTITDVFIYANDAFPVSLITYKIDSPKLREIKKGINTENDYFSEFHFEYEWKVSANKYNL